MVKFWVKMLDKSIAKTKIRIQFCERNGIGDSTIREKARLKKQERQRELNNQK